MYIAPIKDLGKSEGSMYMKESDKKKIEELWLTVYDEKLVVEFKSGLTVEVEE